MYIRLIRNKPQGNAITGRLVIDGRWFCDTLERVGYQIPALCYHVRVTMSPKFKRLLPIVQNVPRALPEGCKALSGSPRTSRVSGESGGTCRLMTQCVSLRDHVAEREGIRFHRGTRPEHSTGCILLAKEKEIELTNLILKAQNHEEIILDVTDFRPGTEYGYDHPCEPELQEHKRDARRAEQRYYQLFPEERQGAV